MFINLANDDTVLCRIVGLCIFENFTELVKVVGEKPCGWELDTPPENPDADMEMFYPRADIEKYGAFGIVLKREI